MTIGFTQVMCDHDNNLLVYLSSQKIRLGRHLRKALNHFTFFFKLSMDQDLPDMLAVGPAAMEKSEQCVTELPVTTRQEQSESLSMGNNQIHSQSGFVVIMTIIYLCICLHWMNQTGAASTQGVESLHLCFQVE